MSAGAKVAAAVASGYLLGRTKKLKLAITVGSMLAGKKIATNPRDMMKQLNELVEGNPELSKLADQVRDKLFEAARAAAIAAASNRMEGLSDSIRDRTDRMLAPAEAEGEGAEDDEGEEEARGRG